MTTPTLSGKNIILRPITRDDTADIVRFRNSARVRENFVYRETFTKASHERWLVKEVESGNTMQWMMCVPSARYAKEEQGEAPPVGSVFVKNIHDEVPEYGIFIGEEDALGKGYASEAAKMVVSYCASNGIGKKLGLRVFTDNAPAIKSYEAAGFRVVKTLSDVTCSDGTVKDMLWMETAGDDV